MNFRKKILLSYTIFIIIIVAILGGVFLKHREKTLEDSEYKSLKGIANQMSQQLENKIYPMDFITVQVLSDSRFISAMTTLTTINREEHSNQSYIDEAKRVISSMLLTYSIDKNFYSVNIFNIKGDFITSNLKNQHTTGDLKKKINQWRWRKHADDARGRMVILPSYSDPWTSSHPKVFSVARAVQWPNRNMGYIEVQQSYDEFEEIFYIPNEENIKIIAKTNQGEIFFYDNLVKNEELDYYANLEVPINKTIIENPVTKKDEILASTYSDYTGITIILSQDKKSLLEPLLFPAKSIMIISIIIIIVCFIYISIVSKKLVEPIRQLKEKMEEMELQNLPEKIIIESSNDEIKALNNSFQHLRQRLDESIKRELKYQELQMKANFDSLQAQVNPHFIYNILTVLSNKGIENNDEEICDICESVASMLRYSTSTLKPSATIEEEIEHVRNYLVLMKKRYEHRLEFEIDIAKSIYKQPIPKIVLQQIVENSVNHGFKNGQKVVKIQIKGYLLNGWWYIDFIDNGLGFEEHILSELKIKMELMRKEIMEGANKTGLAIGGMGIINTFARLLLFYNNEFDFKIKNLECGGAQATIGSTMKCFEEEEKSC